MTRGPAGVDSRVRRLLDVLTWIADHDDSLTLAELADRFGGTTEDIRRDLVLAMCSEFRGAFPGDLIDLDIDDDVVTLRDPKLAGAGRVLDRATAFRVLAAVRLLQQLNGSRVPMALETAATQLAARLGGYEATVETQDTDHVDQLRDGISAGTRFQLEYKRPFESSLISYVIVPQRLWFADGVWFFEAEKEVPTGLVLRTFRADRVRSLQALPEPTTSDRTVAVREAAEMQETVLLRVPKSFGWIAVHYRGEVKASHRDDTLDVEITFFAPAPPRLAELLLRCSEIEILEASTELLLHTQQILSGLRSSIRAR